MRTTGGAAARKPGEPLRHVEAALGAEVDVDERDVGSEGQRRVDGLIRRRGEADDGDPLVGEQLPGGLEELGLSSTIKQVSGTGGGLIAPARIAEPPLLAPDGERPTWGPEFRYARLRASR